MARRPSTRLSQSWRLSTSRNLIFIAKTQGARLVAGLAAAEATGGFCCVLRGNPSLGHRDPSRLSSLWRRGPAPGPSSGCGTEEQAVKAANLGLKAIGTETAGRANAVAKAQKLGGAAAPPIPGFPMRFAWRRSPSLSIPSLDCGLFHVFGDKDRRSFEEKTYLSRSAKWMLPDTVSQRVSTRGHGSSAGYATQDPDQFRPWLARGFD